LLGQSRRVPGMDKEMNGENLKKVVGIIRGEISGTLMRCGIMLTTEELDFILNLAIIELFKWYNKEQGGGQ